MSNPRAKPNVRKKSLVDGHVHVYNLCACGKMRSLMDDDHHSGLVTGDDLLGKDDGNKRLGQALISVAVSEQQRDRRQQYDDDSQQVASSLETIADTLDSLSADVKELGRCLKSGAFAAAQLKKVQEKIGIQLKTALLREKQKMAVKDKEVAALDRKLRRVQKNQASLQSFYKAYKVLRIVVIVLIVALVLLGILAVQDGEEIDASSDGQSNSNGTVSGSK